VAAAVAAAVAVLDADEGMGICKSCNEWIHQRRLTAQVVPKGIIFSILRRDRRSHSQ
jgi:hypothetical protein